MKKTKLLQAAVAMLLAATMFVGCSNDSDTGTTDSGSASGADNQGASASYKEEVVVGASAKLTNIDPQSVNNTQHKRLFLLTHNTLVSYNPEDQSLTPELALDWKVADDLVTWEIELRPDVTFHNGDTLTVDDVIFTFERGQATATSSAQAMFNNIASMEKIDDLNMKIVLVAPNMDWEYIMAEPALSILSKETLEGDSENAEKAAVGTGLWQHYEMLDSNYVKLERYDGYWGESTETKYLNLRTIPEASARVIALQNGEIDVCLDPGNTELQFIAEDETLDLIQYQGTAQHYFAFNVQEAPGNDPLFRQAVAYALNYDDIAYGAYDGFVTKANVFWGWHQAGYAGDEIEGYNYDLDKAKELIAQSQYANGATLEIVTTSKQRVVAAEIIQSQLKEIGVEVIVTELDSAGFTAQTNAGEHQACLYGISYGTYADDARRTHVSGSTTNKSFQNNDRIHEIMDEAKAESDVDARMELYKEWQEVAIEEVAVIPMFYLESAMGKLKTADGIVYEPGGIHDFTYLTATE